jgi:hypothetical protein
MPILAKKPGFGQPTSAIGLDHPSLIQRDPQVIADTAADRTSNILDNGRGQPIEPLLTRRIATNLPVIKK